MNGTAFRPTLLNGCARAATAAEARFRISDGNSRPRKLRVFALDPQAEALLLPLASKPWQGARFLVCTTGDDPSNVPLRAFGGPAGTLESELEGVDLVVMVARSAAGGRAAREIARCCVARGVRPIGLALSNGAGVVASALRPWASVLVVSGDEEYLAEMLKALHN